MNNFYQSMSANVSTLSIEMAHSSMMGLLQNVWVLGTLALLMTLAVLWAWKVQTHVAGVTISFSVLTMVTGYMLVFASL